MVTIHALKILPEYFAAVKNGTKKAEYRYNDRDFNVGDIIILREYENGEYTGRVLRCKITHILTGVYGIPDGWAVLSVERHKVAVYRKNRKMREDR